jgi:antitoxin ParD1/3/4
LESEELSISLPKDMVRMVREQASTGAYTSVSEVISEALRLWESRRQERERRLDGIRAKIDEAARNPERIGDEEVGRHFKRRSDDAEKKQAG